MGSEGLTLNRGPFKASYLEQRPGQSVLYGTRLVIGSYIERKSGRRVLYGTGLVIGSYIEQRSGLGSCLERTFVQRVLI